ncbi:MAG: hypothetical protein HRT87_10435 [Legionellales bacterium]|nr:hypothetical protein [Legionellales bacterium]
MDIAKINQKFSTNIILNLSLIFLYLIMNFNYSYAAKVLKNETPFTIAVLAYIKLHRDSNVSEIFGIPARYEMNEPILINPDDEFPLEQNYGFNIKYYVVDFHIPKYIDKIIENYKRNSLGKINITDIQAIIKEYAGNFEYLQAKELNDLFNLQTITFIFTECGLTIKELVK